MAPSAVADIVKRLPHETVTVGVFRDEAPTRVVEIANQIGLRAVQLHGVESIEDTRWVADRVGLDHQGLPRRPPEHRPVRRVRGPAPADRRGQPRIRRALRLATGRRASIDPRRLIVSGGLRPENVGAAIAHLHPWGVDVASGVEASPGREGPGKLREFIAAAHARPPGQAAAAVPGRLRRRTGSTPGSDGGTTGRPSLFDWQDELVAAEIMGDPGPTGRFGQFGGRFVPESLVPACIELEAAFRSAWADPSFHAELDGVLAHYGGRPTPVTECGRLSDELGSGCC